MSDLIVAVPVKDEAERIADCLTALAWQQDVRHHQVLLLLNNCQDASEAVVRKLAPCLPIQPHIVSRHFPAGQANAGHARRAALQCAELLLDGDGILLTTDADSRVAPDWLAANLAALRQGAELVAGRAIIDPVEARAIPAHLHEDDARECAYAALLDEIDWLLDPDPADPWPRHSEESGASLAVTRTAYRRAGGMPAVAIGEDRAFVAAARRTDARIRHAPEIAVTVSGRLDGRAAGGMADTMRRRTVAQDALIDDRLEPARDRARRACWRARFHRAWDAETPDDALARALDLPPGALAAMLAAPYAGTGWAMAEAASRRLARRPVARVDLAAQTAIALRIADRLRAVAIARRPPAADRFDSALLAVADPA